MTTFEINCKHFKWINIVRPTAEDIQRLSKSYTFIHPLHLDDILSPIERPKIDEEESYLFVVMQFPVWDSQHRLSRPSEVDFIVTRNALVTIHDATLKPLVRRFSQCELYEEQRDKLAGKGANDTFYAIIDELIDYLFPILHKVDANIRTIEDGIFTADTRTIIRDIALARRDIIALRRMIRHLVPVVERLTHIKHPIIQADLEEYFDDSLDHVYTARDIIDENYEIIGGLSETADTLVSHRINEVMRVLTVISVIMLPLTLVSGIYGMNIQLPISEHPNAFLIVMGMMVLIVVLMLTYFRHRKWL
jgi:magnesium transporter